MRCRTISVMMMVALVVGALAFAPAASAGGYPPPPPVQPPGVVHTLPLAQPADQVKATQAKATQAKAQASAPRSVRVGSIAFTGADLLRWALVALSLVAAGTVLVVANRRRDRVSSSGTRL